MPRFMIEVEHDDDVGSCNIATELLLTTGSHFLTHADWGCLDGVHTAWIVVEAETREQARAVLPPFLRPRAKVVGLNWFGMEQLDEFLVRHRRRRRVVAPRQPSRDWRPSRGRP